MANFGNCLILGLLATKVRTPSIPVLTNHPIIISRKQFRGGIFPYRCFSPVSSFCVFDTLFHRHRHHARFACTVSSSAQTTVLEQGCKSRSSFSRVHFHGMQIVNKTHLLGRCFARARVCGRSNADAQFSRKNRRKNTVLQTDGLRNPWFSRELQCRFVPTIVDRTLNFESKFRGQEKQLSFATFPRHRKSMFHVFYPHNVCQRRTVSD